MLARDLILLGCYTGKPGTYFLMIKCAASSSDYDGARQTTRQDKYQVSPSIPRNTCLPFVLFSSLDKCIPGLQSYHGPHHRSAHRTPHQDLQTRDLSPKYPRPQIDRLQVSAELYRSQQSVLQSKRARRFEYESFDSG